MADEIIPQSDANTEQLAEKRARQREAQAKCRANRSAEKWGYYKRHRTEHAAKNRDKLNAKMREWREKNREHLTEWRRGYEAKPESKERARASELRRQTIPERAEKKRESRRAWSKKNPEKAKASWHNTRARRVAAPGTHTQDDIADILRAQRGRCAVCRVPLRGRYHVDHIVPLARGGTNERRNIQLLCGPCNVRKSWRDPIEFMQQRGLLL